MQTTYDVKLNNATYDALKAFQLNTINSDTSDLTNSKIRDIEASANTFFNSIASNFNMAGYNQEILAEYVPALVYTMYDGYYIYSKYTNQLDTTNSNEVIITNEDGESETITGSDEEISKDTRLDTTYKTGDSLTGLKPYVYYSCRYQHRLDDFVITYSLDNYITIQGTIGGNWVYEYGYLLDNVEGSGDNITYRGIPIETSESLKENVWIDNNIQECTYIKANGVKFYKEPGSDQWFSIMNGKKYPQQAFKTASDAGIRYYQKAKAFKEKIYELGLNDLKANEAVDENGEQLMVLDEDGKKTSTPKFGSDLVFDFGNMDSTSIEDPNSNFNQHRLAVIRYSIEKNLSIAIANYNDYSTTQASFQMPKLKEDEWEKIMNNVSIISFLQGLNIGGKVYNGYSIITNNKNKEVVNENSIYMVTDDKQYHRANDSDLAGKNIVQGVLNIDFERKTGIADDGQSRYYMPKSLGNYDTGFISGCYSSIVNQTNVEQTDNFYKYMKNKGDTQLTRKYFTALGRERYSLYKTNNDPDAAKAEFTQ